MPRDIAQYFPILAGASLTEEDELVDSPRYYGYTKPAGAYVIMKKLDNGDGTFNYTFHVGNVIANFASDWTNRDSLTTYKRSGDFKRQ